MNDISSRSDIESIIQAFYEKVQVDPLLAPHFSHVDWKHHLPVMFNFWSSMILGDQSYQGNPFQKHIGLPLEEQHFLRWLQLFTGTVDEKFDGPQADEIKKRAQSIAAVFQFKLGLRK